MAPPTPPKTNILCLDGGGVRGYSSLLILRELLCLVRLSIEEQGSRSTSLLLEHTNGKTSNITPVFPGDVFDIIVGTSTGGLIALMIVKMGMSVDACIDAYKQLSPQIFTQKHLMGTLTRGIGGVSKYCGKKYKNFVVEHVIKPVLPRRTIRPEDYRMSERSTHKSLHCTLVCCELDPETFDIKVGHAAHLCTDSCDSSFARITVADAARATSAAPTFFSPVRCAGRVLADGGYGTYNNPSFTACEHWEFYWNREGGSVQIVNIGTGTAPRKARQQKSLMERVPIRTLQGILRTKKDLIRIAVDSEKTAQEMRFLQSMDPQKLRFDRFSANTPGLSFIKLDAHKKLGKIEELTKQYLEDRAVLQSLRDAAKRLADTYISRKTAGMMAAQDIIQAA